MILAFNKPYGVLSQFTKGGTEHRTFAEFGFPENVYPIGRLDRDSEGLILLSDEKELNDRLLNPNHNHERTYHVQVEGIATREALTRLESGVMIQGRKTKQCKARLIADPGYPERNPPIRFRRSVPTGWIELILIEGRNRQVRRMTASVGLPTLRLVRVAIGAYLLGDLKPGMWQKIHINAL
ncbi:MAG: pseudouridine synthase [Candidatus Omnitrophica bacterium]|nr:pseudouridine synthase [Candidatus Omnitrophota bacterium]